MANFIEIHRKPSGPHIIGEEREFPRSNVRSDRVIEYRKAGAQDREHATLELMLSSGEWVFAICNEAYLLKILSYED